MEGGDERPIMEEAPEWLEHDVDVLEEEESEEDVPLPRETYLEEEIESAHNHHLHRDRQLGEELKDNPLQLPP
jgi:hypothetical protein